jgi:hypothetical protein
MLNYTLTDNSVTVLGDDFVPKTMPATHPAFAQVVSAIQNGEDDAVKQLMDLPAAIATFMQGHITIADRVLYYDNRPIHNSLTTRILQFMEAGQPELAQPLINFLEKVKGNPSFRAVEGLYDWAARSGLPITPDGDIIAYKIVRNDYRDYRSGQFDNSVGQIVEVDRNEVDENPEQTCSHGLHFCSIGYLPHYYQGDSGRHVMVLKINPADVVAFPRDYNVSKGRACRYEVIGEVPSEKAAGYFRNTYVYEPSFSSERPESQLNVDLEVGCFYRTRDGRVVEIQDYDNSECYPYAGRVVNGDGDVEWWTYDGLYSETSEHELDLVELLENYDFEEEAEAKPTGGWLSRLITGLTS